MELNDIAPGLIRHPSGYWIAGGESEGRYPEGGSEFCASVEEQSFWFAHRNRVIVKAVRRFVPPGPLLDVGAGNGYVAAALSTAGFDTIVIEPSGDGVRQAVARGLTNVVCGVLPSAAFREGIAGGIGLFDVVEHTPDDEHFLAALRPYLKDDGLLYLTVPAYGWLWSREDVAAGHYRRYGVARLRRSFEAAGYRLEYATHIFWWLPAPVFFVRVIGDRLFGGRAYETPKSAHTGGSKSVRAMLLATLAPEEIAVTRGWRIPFGGSILAVARKTSG
ncbi:MAG TPA: class I SAM-dependent methyltransferase [Vicinamibacterales bacterium]